MLYLSMSAVPYMLLLITLLIITPNLLVIHYIPCDLLPDVLLDDDFSNFTKKKKKKKKAFDMSEMDEGLPVNRAFSCTFNGLYSRSNYGMCRSRCMLSVVDGLKLSTVFKAPGYIAELVQA